MAEHSFQCPARLGNPEKLTPENIAYVDTLLAQYGLGDFKNSLPNQLSGGMRQRAALIRTLAVRPDILLLDEPFSALDYQTRLSVSDEIGTIIREEGKPPSSSRMIFPKPSAFPTAWWCSPSVLHT